ncbi:MAG: DUF362 domain-containing protein [Candidatus Marinimicrobia bacterium]|nr:DUF362 domain-containing protein [Candidatus Neomarinimicrobiota bacterium]
MTRRNFVKASLSMSALTFGSNFWLNPLFGANKNTLPDIVAVRNGEPDVMYHTAIEALGGIKKFIKNGQTVLVKPNIGWAREPENGANTNPLLVETIVKDVLQAGAKKVYVFDHTCNESQKCYTLSKIQESAKNAGAIVVPGDLEKDYVDIKIPQAKILKETKIHRILAESDAVINVPVLKHHGSSKMTCAMKNLMGVVWDRGYYHRSGLHQCIADFCLHTKPVLNIVDGYRVTMDNGPQRAQPEDVVIRKMLLVSQDIVAVDAAVSKILNYEPEQIEHILFGHEMKIGNMDLTQLQIHRIVL